MDSEFESGMAESGETVPAPARARFRRLLQAGAGLVALGAVVFLVTRGFGGDAAVNPTGKAAAAQAGKSADGDAKKDEKAPVAVPVAVAEATTGAIHSYLSATANLVAEDEVKVLAEAEGRVAQLAVEEGDPVRRGQLLVALAREDAQIAFDKAKLRADNARQAYERGEKMHRERLLAEESFDKLAMDHALAKQELAEAERRLEKTVVRAPIDGRVTMRAARLGQHVRPGDELFVVADFEPLVARIYVPERDALALAAGTEVRLTLKADEAVRFGGRIRQVAPVVDPATGTVKVTVEAVEPPSAVRPGGFVTVDIVRETRSRVVLVPRAAVLRELSAAHLFVAAEGKAARREVTLGLEEGEQLEIRSGLAAGEQVVVVGQGSLKDGAIVEITVGAPQPVAVAAHR